jgi:hypothetical protein
VIYLFYERKMFFCHLKQLSTPELSHLTKDGGFVDITSAGLGRTEYDFNLHVYEEPVDAVLVKGNVTNAQVHRFARPAAHATVNEKIAFLLRTYGSDHHCVGATLELNRANDSSTENPSSATVLNTSPFPCGLIF